MKKLLLNFYRVGIILNALFFIGLTSVSYSQTVDSYNPANNALGISISPQLIITFHQDSTITLGSEKIIRVVEVGNLSNNISLTTGGGFDPADDRLQINNPNNTFTIDLSGDNLDYNTAYFVYIPEDALLLNGYSWNDLSNTSNPGWTFTTEPAPTPPTINSTTPADGATDVAIDTDLSITFNEDIVKGNDDYLKIFKDGGSGILIDTSLIDIAGPVLTVDASVFALTESSDYHVEIDPGFVVSASSGADFEGISDNTTWNFTTSIGAPEWMIEPELSNQTTVDVDLHGRTDQDGTYYYVITESLQKPSETEIENGQNHQGSNMTVSGNESMAAGIAFSTNIDISTLDQGKTYYMHVVASNAAGYSSVVTIPTPIDLVGPSLGTVSPSNGSTNVPVNTRIILNYSEKIYMPDGTEVTDDNIKDHISLTLAGSTTNLIDTAWFSNNDETITLSLASRLSGSTSYTLSFSARFKDQHGNEQSEISNDRTFTTEEIYTWNGGSTNWGASGNWDTGAKPDGNSVLIPGGVSNYPEITSGTESINNLYIEPGAYLINNGATLNVAGQFILESSSDQNASYLPRGGSLNVTDSSKVKIKQVISNPGKNYFTASPVSGATKGSAGITDAIVYFDNPNNQYVFLNTDESPLNPGTGYVARNPSDIVFSGTPVHENVTINVDRTPSRGLGWNLIGNPYTASIDLDELLLAGVDSSFWLFQNDSGIYGTYNMATGVSVSLPLENENMVPSNFSFWVRVNEAASEGTVGFTVDNTHANTHSYLKSTSQKEKYPVLKLATTYNGFRDETAITLISSDETGKDMYNSAKLFSNNDSIFDLYSMSNNKSMSINSLPLNDDITTVILGVRVPDIPTKTCKLSITRNNLPPGTIVLLEDKMEDVTVNLSKTGTYEFSSGQAGKIEDRFSIILQSGTLTNLDGDEENHTEIEKSYFYTTNSQIISYIAALNNPNYKLFDVNGRLIKEGSLNANSKNFITVHHEGTVVFVVESDEGTKTFKTVF